MQEAQYPIDYNNNVKYGITHLSQAFNSTTDIIQYSQSTIDIAAIFTEKHFVLQYRQSEKN